MEESELKKEVKSWKSIAIAGMVITLLAMTILAIGTPQQIVQYKTFLRNESKTMCENFEMRYRYIDSGCYECYVPLKSLGNMTNVTFVYRFCKVGDYSRWNRTMKYLESFDDGKHITN